MRFAKIPDDVNPVMPGGFVKERYTILIDISKERLQKYLIFH